MCIAGVAITVADTFSRLDMDPNYIIDMYSLNDLSKSDYKLGQHVHMTMVLSQSLSDNAGISISVL